MHQHTQPKSILTPSLYVGNLSRQVTQPLLYEIFSALGEVASAKIITDKLTGESQGYGFVDYRYIHSAEAAMNSLNGRSVYGQEMKLNWAAVATGKEDTSTHYHLFVGDLSPDVTDAMLWEAFKSFESLSEARVMIDPAHNRSRGYGFVAFRDRADAELALSTMNGVWLGSRSIRVNWANQKTLQKTASHLDFDTISSQAPASNTTVYVGNLAPETLEHSLHLLFEKFGTIEELRMQVDKGYAFVRYADHSMATRAIIHGNGEMVGVRAIRCSWGKEKSTETVSTSAAAPSVAYPPTVGYPYPMYNPYMMYGGYPSYPTTPTSGVPPAGQGSVYPTMYPTYPYSYYGTGGSQGY